MRFLRGPWQWMTEGGMSYWAPPPGFTGLDLRTLPQQSQQGGTPGLGIFCGVGNPGSEYDELGRGNWHDVKTTQKLKDALPSPVGYSPKGADLVGLILDLLTDGADPDGIDGPKPLVPTTQGRIELHLGQSHHERFRWGGNNTPKIKRLLRKEFAQLIQDVQDGKMRAKQHLRIMDFWCEKYKVDDWREFVPDALQADVPGREPHETTITENFNQADSTTLGPTLTWTEVNGSLVTESNVCEGRTGGSRARAESDLSSSDHYAQGTYAVKPAGSNNVGMITRYASAADTGYLFIIDGRFFKIVTGTLTNLATGSAVALSSVVKGQSSGSSHTGYDDGVAFVGPTTDTAISGGTRCGLYCDSDYGVDDWSASDLAASGIVYTQLERGTRGILRGMYTKY